MKRLLFFILLAIFLFNLLPVLILEYMDSDEILLPGLSADKTVRVWFPEEQKVKTLQLEEYIVGVVAAEMPASFSPEALKAQAIAARTYTLYKAQINKEHGNKLHPSDADVCTSPLCCQAWISPKEEVKRWGYINALFYQKKIRDAVSATKGMVITYQGKMIDPVYHSTCGGHTEDAKEVWQNDTPYLKGVECKYDKDSPKYSTKVEVSLKDIDKAFGTNISKLHWYSLQRLVSPIKVLSNTNGGRVKKIKIGNKTFTGTEVRSRLGLNSAKFSVQVKRTGLVFTVKGYGHGVGMCQYGAGGMAKTGATAEDILNHYYKDIKIVKT